MSVQPAEDRYIVKIYSVYLSRANIGRKYNHTVGKKFMFKVLRCIHSKRGLCNRSNYVTVKIM